MTQCLLGNPGDTKANLKPEARRHKAAWALARALREQLPPRYLCLLKMSLGIEKEVKILQRRHVSCQTQSDPWFKGRNEEVDPNRVQNKVSVSVRGGDRESSMCLVAHQMLISLSLTRSQKPWAGGHLLSQSRAFCPHRAELPIYSPGSFKEQTSSHGERALAYMPVDLVPPQ